MNWLIPESVQKRCYAYLVQRYLGRFFEEKLDPNQLTVDFYNGKCSLKDIRLDNQAINELLGELNSPLEIVDGSIGNVFLNVPWKSLLTESSTIEITSLRLTFQPKQRNESDPFLATSMLESMWTSMTSSLHLAEDCIKQEPNLTPNNSQSYEGLEAFAQTIDSILSRIKIKFIDTVIQLEYLPKDSGRGVGLVFHIDLISYTDESVNDPSKEEATDLSRQDDKKAYLEQSYTAKSVRCEGVSLSTVEFSYKARVIAQTSSSIIESSTYDTMTESTADDEDDNFDYYSSSNERIVIPFGRIDNKLEVILRMKLTEDLEGPKFSIKFDVGAFLVFCTPRQLHLLIEFLDGFANPDVADNTHEKYVGKPMTQEDLQKIEQDIQQQMLLAPNPHRNLQNLGRGWATGAVDEHELDEHFSPLRNRSGLYESAMSVASTMESSISSSVTSSCTEATTRTHRRMYRIDADPTADIIHFDVHLMSLYFVLLHEDLLVESSNVKSTLNAASVKQTELIVENFFKNSKSVFQARDFKEANNAISEACEINHLRLLAGSIHIEGDQKKTRSAFAISGHLEAMRLELKEFLFNKDVKTCEQVPLIIFTEQKTGSLSTAKSSLKLNFKHIEKTAKSDLSKSGPKTELAFSLNKCTVQLDITLIDRISTVLNPQSICTISKPYNPWGHGPPVSSESIKVDSKLDIKVNCPLMSLIIRFPKLDFRPPHINETSWWQRNVRPDFLTLDLDTVCMHTIIQTKQLSQDFSISASRISCSYCENMNTAPIKIAKAGQEENFGSLQDAIEDCKLTIKIMTKKNLLNETTVDVPLPTMQTSIIGILEQNQKIDNGPFSSKRCVHQSDTPHNKNQTDKSIELLIPGEKSEINEFIKSSLASSRIQVDISLPTLSMQLISKHLYELIYNRINNDLLLWEPRAVNVKVNSTSNYENLSVPLSHLEGDEVFTLCKTGLSHDSESESEEETEDNSCIYYSTYASKSKIGELKQTEPTHHRHVDSYLTLNFQIGHGVLCMFCPVRDSTTNNVIPGQQGEFLINVNDANIFIVNGYMGEPNLGYICVQLHNAQLYHCDMMSAPSQSPPLRGLDVMPGQHLHPTIYKSESGVLAVNGNRGGEREMVTLCVKIQASHETHNAKSISLAVGFDKVSLRHRMCPEPNSWISQLIDFFTVQDYPIPGYQTKEILIELFCHFWDSAIDYRPRYLPLRSIITLGSFSISSHLSAEINTSTLRFIAEDCGLFLSQKGVLSSSSKSKLPYNGPIDLKRDYINVIELGVFEISLKTADKKNTKIPHFDLRASNDLIKIRTCADSARALTLLIKYFADDGDLVPPEDLTNSGNSAYSSPRHQQHEELVSLTSQEIVNVTEVQQEKMHNLIKDAMDDVPVVTSGKQCKTPKSDLYSYNGAKVFYFPGENQTAAQEQQQVFPQVVSDLGELSIDPLGDEEIDDEFCFIDKELGFNIYPKSGEPEIRWVSDDPVRVVENHFSVPSERLDPLKTPKNFPVPTMLYTLCEMTIIWHMYGGNDFGAIDKEKKKTVNFSDIKLKDSVNFSNQAKQPKVFIEQEKSGRRKEKSWILKGGPNRDHNVLMELQLNKIRFRHDVYPETSSKASRQVLLVSEFEIRDRLLSSELNKFLYQYTSQDRPKRSNADMLVIKTLHVRPDPKLRAQECGLKISLLPLRFNIDQDALQFLIEFFCEIGGEGKDDDVSILSSKNNTPVHQPPIMTVNLDENDENFVEQAEKIVKENLDLIVLDEGDESNLKEEAPKSTYATAEDSPIYFRKVAFLPDVPIRLDYHGKRVDFALGTIHGLLMGLTQLNCSELRLKRIVHRHGLLGFDKLMAHLLREWINDIKKNQIPSLLSGVGPVYSLVQFVQGIKDLFYLPFEQYKKDGRFLRGLHRGANSFTTSTAMAALELTTRLIHLIQITAETAFDMLTPGPSVSYNPKTKKRRKRYGQPKDIREGVTNAYKVVKEGIGETADNIVQVATHEHEQKGYSGAVGGVIRQIPQTIIKPLILATEATNNVLDGIRCQYVTDARKEADEKWRSDPN